MISTEYQTDRLSLRVLNEADTALVLSFYEHGAAEFSRYEPLDPLLAQRFDFQKKVLHAEYQAFIHGQMLRFFLFLKNNPMQIIGTLSYRSILHGAYQSCQIGYKMDDRFRRQGYCSEAIAFSDQLVHRTLSIHRIFALVQPDNLPSSRMLTGLGYQREGLVRDAIFLDGAWHDHEQYARIFRD